ncbi:MAG: hypothetical protein DMF01_09950 [Verrucomicrobia bacterium]|nr:MAG: hypothetical protein DMF01_09950 [Verrucomicrobiota bacterium]
MTKRILLVDDDRSIRESLSKILRAENYEVVLGENGQHNFIILRSQDFAQGLTNGALIVHQKNSLYHRFSDQK